jgi:hypothetical protein
MGCSIFAAGCCDNFATGPRTLPLCYLLEGHCCGKSAEMHMFLVEQPARNATRLRRSIGGQLDCFA